MQVKALDHVNIVSANIAASASFYAALLDLAPDPRIPEAMCASVVWLCDEQGRPIIHLNAVSLERAFNREFPAGVETGAIHHIALACADYDDMIVRLQTLGAAFETNEVPQVGLRQIFTRDPNNVLLELNFHAA